MHDFAVYLPNNQLITEIRIFSASKHIYGTKCLYQWRDVFQKSLIIIYLVKFIRGNKFGAHKFSALGNIVSMSPIALLFRPGVRGKHNCKPWYEHIYLHIRLLTKHKYCNMNSRRILIIMIPLCKTLTWYDLWAIRSNFTIFSTQR